MGALSRACVLQDCQSFAQMSVNDTSVKTTPQLNSIGNFNTCIVLSCNYTLAFLLMTLRDTFNRKIIQKCETCKMFNRKSMAFNKKDVIHSI